MFEVTTSGNININGINYNGTSFSIINGRFVIDDVEQSQDLGRVITISINGNVDNLTTASGNVVVTGNVGNLSTVSGTVSCRDVTSDVKTVSGNVRCESVAGNVKTVSGDIVGL